MAIYLVYLITNKINGKRYTGQTIRSLEVRWKQHLYRNSCHALYSAIKKYGKENFETKVLSRCDSAEEANHREAYYITLFGTMSPNGYNLVSGGCKNRTISEESRERMRVSQMISSSKPETVEKIRKSRNLFIKNNPEYSKNHSKKLKFRYIANPHLLDELALSCGGKPFKVFDKTTMELIWEGVNQQECERKLGVKQANISNCLKLKKKTCSGYIFRYVGEENVKYPHKDGGRKRIQNIETEEIFVCAKSAAEKYDLWPRNIRRAATKGLTAGNFHWRFV